MRAQTPVVEWTAETLVRPRKASQDLGLRDLAVANARLVRDDEAAIEGGSHARERCRHVGHEDGMAVGVHDRAIVAAERQGAAPVEEERRRGSHERTLARGAAASPERRGDFM